MIASTIASLLFVASAVTADPSGRSVTFSAKSTGIVENAPLEFLFVTPESDRDYESVFVTDAKASEIAAAFDKAGIRRGLPIDGQKCRFWPSGMRVEVSPSPWLYIEDRDSASGRLPVAYTGGSRDANGALVAETNMPSAVFALYSLGQSMLLLDDALDQSEVYGRFVSKQTLEKGTRVEFTVSWNGASRTKPYELALKPGEAKGAIEAMRQAVDDCGLDVSPVFSDEFTVQEAASVANALAVLDSRSVRINGFADGQFYYRAFLPLEKWRDRSQRLTQPIEAYFTNTNTAYVAIDEDWSVEGLDPKLTPRDITFDEAKRATTDTCFIYAPPDMKLKRLYDFKRSVAPAFRNWYIYINFN